MQACVTVKTENTLVRKLGCSSRTMRPKKNSSRLTDPLASNSLKLFGLMGFVTLAVLLCRFVTLISCIVTLVLFLVFLDFVDLLVLRSACLCFFPARRGRTLHTSSLSA
jgi:hypothetical protein